jgi:putative N6-adenine-specific DNA methylase
VNPSKKPNHEFAFAVTAPGLESICADELSRLGIRGKAEAGGVAWKGDLLSIARANLWLRTASRVLVRVAEFRATAFFELELQAKRIVWERFVTPETAVEFRVTCRKSKLYHSDAVAQRFAEALVKRVRGASVVDTSASDEDEAAPVSDRQLFIVRFFHDVCTVSVDTSGALLHMRGYRQAVAKAPLRETLAAAVLLGAGWNGDTPLLDPMCGSGTIPIEAACIARRIAPGRDRAFAFLRWPELKQATWKKLIDEARANELATSPAHIEGSDRDEGAISAAQANAERADVSQDITFSVRPISAMTPADPPGLIAINPPYGVRVGESKALRDLYAQLGNVARRKRAGWRLAMLSADPALERQTKLALDERFQTRNGGIPVRLVVGDVPSS